MKFVPIEPPRIFDGAGVMLSDVGRLHLENDEMVTFVTGAGQEYDATRKSWGFYAAGSLNKRLPDHGLRSVLVGDQHGRIFLILVELGKEVEAGDYLQSWGYMPIWWLPVRPIEFKKAKGSNEDSPMTNIITSKDYHDYYVKNGEFVGEFEQMYKNIDDPWNIEKLGKRLDMDAAIQLARRAAPASPRVLDVGCGKGLFTSFLHEALGGEMQASDVSETAVEQAADRYKRFSNLHFFPFDLSKVDTLKFPKDHFDVIVMAQILWCVLPNIRTILKALREHLKPEGSLIISQHFFQPGQQKYGNEVIERPEQLIAMLRELGYDVTETLETDRFVNHHLAISARRRSTGVSK